MTDEERIDLVLDAMAKSGNHRLSVQEFLQDRIKDSDKVSYQRIIKLLEDKRYAERLAKLNATCMLLSPGLDVVNSGGYLKHLERQRSVAEEENRLKKVKGKLDEVNLNLNSFLLKYKWVPYILSGAAIIISIVAIIISAIRA